MMIRFWLAVLCVVSAWAGHAAAADDYPNRPVRLVVPFAPGGSTDVVARFIGEALSTRLGKTVIVDNKPGGGANIGTNFVAHAPADGYTLLLASPTQTINATLYRDLPYDLAKDLVPVALIGSSPSILLVSSAFPIRSVADLIAQAKANPGKLSYASAGNGSTTHLAAELFKKATGIRMEHIPFKGAQPAMEDVVAGRIEVVFGFVSDARKFVDAGLMRALAIAGSKRLPEFPDVPTLDELGIKGAEVAAWYGILAPTGTPAPIIARLNSEISSAVQATTPRLNEMGVQPTTASPAQFGDFLRRETDKWANAVKFSNTKID
jgi:tripartite-type tricarboxylate transporter receptor subunit TctC